MASVTLTLTLALALALSRYGLTPAEIIEKYGEAASMGTNPNPDP